jgi:hypothetical protein
MSTVIKLKRSETASSVPTTSDLEVGEVAVNTIDQKIYMRSSSGIVTIANNSTSSGGGIALTDLSVGAEGTASGNGDISYDNSTGVFTYTPPEIPVDLSDLTDSTGLIPTDISDLTDTTNLIPTTLTDLSITDGTSGQVLKTDGAGNFFFGDVSGGGAAGSAFTGIAVSGQSTVYADSATDTLTLVGAGLNSITTDASTDTITIGTPTGIPFVKEDGTSTSLNLSVEAGTLSQAVASLYIPFTKEDGTSVTTLVMN